MIDFCSNTFATLVMMLATILSPSTQSSFINYISLIMLVSLLNAFRHLGSVRVQVNAIRLYTFGQNAGLRADMNRYYTDPEYRRRKIDRMVHVERLRKARDPDYVAKRKAESIETHRKRKSCERTWSRKLFSDWLRSGWHTADLPWKTHRPEVFSQAVERPCSGCQLPDHKTKFWWTSISESERHLCGRCASKLSWEEVCPKGFENTATSREFTARAKELGIDKPLRPKL